MHAGIRTITSWLVDVLNVLTGNLDRIGGALFPKAAAGSRNTTGVPGKGRGMRPGEKKSRARGAPQVAGELPSRFSPRSHDLRGENRDGQLARDLWRAAHTAFLLAGAHAATLARPPVALARASRCFGEERAANAVEVPARTLRTSTS